MRNYIKNFNHTKHNLGVYLLIHVFAFITPNLYNLYS